jgi:flagellin
LPQSINNNLQSLNAQRHLASSQGELGVAVQRLSSGLRVNSAKDDAAGVSIADRMNTQVRGMAAALRNTNEGISLVQTADGALGLVTHMLQRMRELAVQAANGTNSVADRDSLNAEYLQLAGEATRTLSGTKYNGKAILQTTTASDFQVGANTVVDIDNINTPAFVWTSFSALKTAIGNNVSTAPTTVVAGTDGSFAVAAMAALDAAITVINSHRASFGAIHNRFDNVISNLLISAENQSAARSRIMDADYAAETAALARASILQQAGNAMVAQANQRPQQVLALLRG